jgi:hypothetical protein
MADQKISAPFDGRSKDQCPFWWQLKHRPFFLCSFYFLKRWLQGVIKVVGWDWGPKIILGPPRLFPSCAKILGRPWNFGRCISFQSSLSTLCYLDHRSISSSQPLDDNDCDLNLWYFLSPPITSLRTFTKSSNFKVTLHHGFLKTISKPWPCTRCLPINYLVHPYHK